MARLKPVHPGEILREEFMIPFDLNPNKLALALKVAAANVYKIVRERAAFLLKWLSDWQDILAPRRSSG